METLSDFKKLPLWQQMAEKVGNQELVLVENHVSYILPEMERYVDTFLLYTLHNRAHILNIIRIMGEILGDRVTLVSGLEAMVLILSAAYHDYGMIYSEEERKHISTYENFNNEFLVEQTSARVQFEEDRKVVTPDMAIWYCRWAHAVRVWPKMDEMEPIKGQLLWTGLPIRQALGHVCASHNEPAENIRIDDTRFSPDFLGECDLRFCALLLRIADILDFDNSRSPQSVYDFLDLGNPKNRAEEISRNEWHKHMASHGFKFAASPDGSPLLFKAVPPHPYIEQGIRTFLDLIDYELKAARVVSNLCSERWHKFPFPEKINREGIVTDTYLSGKYRFSLSEDKILDLLTGDNLYYDDFVFIRELLQNAIDTVRHREFMERIKNSKYSPSPIKVSYFKDPDGYYWLRVDDYGMGMNQAIIEKYLLNKGDSYYQSDEFKLEKIKIHENDQKDFVPISRFGIGLLSCFMTCDKIEISTCYYYAAQGQSRDKTRLSIEGRSGYWVIRSEKMHHLADKMPIEAGWEKGYRSEAGTSIACRIKTAREVRGLNIESQIERYLLAPEIPVVFNDKYLGGNREELAMKPWCEHSKTALPIEFLRQCSEFLETDVEGIEIEILPIDLTKKAANGNLTGQLVHVIPHIKMKTSPQDFAVSHFKLRADGTGTYIICHKTIKAPNGNNVTDEISHNISELIALIHFPEKFLGDLGGYARFIWPRISHNGIVVYDNEHQLQSHIPLFDPFHQYLDRHTTHHLSTGLFCFRDALLPELQVSRSTIKRFTPEIIAHIFYATREMNEYRCEDCQPFSYLPDLEGKQRDSDLLYSIELFEKIELYQKDKTYWHKVPCIILKERLATIEELFELAKNGPIAFLVRQFSNSFLTNLIKYIILKNLNIRYVPDKNGYYLEGRLSSQAIAIPIELLSFEPMKFIESADSSKVVLENQSLNMQHPLIKWYIKNAVLIKNDFLYYGYQLFNELLSKTDQKGRTTAVNEILERLRILLPPNARPSTDLNITEEQLRVHNP